MEHLITHLEAITLSEITPEEARDLVMFFRNLPEPKEIIPSMTQDNSDYIEGLISKTRCLLYTRAGRMEVNNASI